MDDTAVVYMKKSTDIALALDIVTDILFKPDRHKISSAKPDNPVAGEVYLYNNISSKEFNDLEWLHLGRTGLPRKCPIIIKTYQQAKSGGIRLNFFRSLFTIKDRRHLLVLVHYPTKSISEPLEDDHYKTG